MKELAPLTTVGAELSVEDTLHLLRTRVLGVALNVLAVAMPVIGLFLAVQAYQSDVLNGVTVLYCSWGLAFPALRLAATWLPFRVSALWLLSLLIVSAAMVATRGGLTVGCLSVSVLTILLATLFFERRGAALALLAVAAVLVTSGFLVVQGHAPPVSSDLWDPLNGAVWYDRA